MPVPDSPDLNIELQFNDAFTDIFLIDATGEYNGTTNLTGYGLPGGVTINAVEALEILVTCNYLGTTLNYTFEISSGTITGAFLAIGGATPTDITAELVSDTWPFTEDDNPFELFRDYGPAPPTLIDDVIKVDYIISSTDVGNEFEYTTTTYIARTYDSENCVKQKFIALSPGCDCFDDAARNALYAKTMLEKVSQAGEYGDVSAAVDALDELNRICNSNAEDCNC